MRKHVISHKIKYRKRSTIFVVNIFMSCEWWPGGPSRIRKVTDLCDVFISVSLFLEKKGVPRTGRIKYLQFRMES